MASGYGLQFQPGVPQSGNGVGDKTRGRVQEPVQVLSTRLPKTFGAGAIAPSALLNAPGGMGMAGAQGNVVAQALAQLAGLPPSMAPSGGISGGPMYFPPSSMSPGLGGAPGGGSLGGYGDWMRRERELNGRPSLDVQRPAPSAATPAPQPPPPIPLPRIEAGSQPPGGGGGPTNPPLPDPFVAPAFPTPQPEPRPDVESIQGIADMLFRKFQGGDRFF
jgi:hypothetical protein